MIGEIFRFENRAQLTDDLQEICWDEDFTAVAFSGGGTPKELMRCLALLWADRPATLIDDRWVAADHADSNARLVKELIDVEPLSIVDLSKAPAEQAAHLSANPPILFESSLMLLGMGGDGHTMSLFPGQSDTDAAFADGAPAYMATEPNADDGNVQVARITMTATPLRRAKRVILHIEGDAKLEKFDAYKSDPNSPIGKVARDPNITMDVFWAP